MSTRMVKIYSGAQVRVTNLPTTTFYYRGRYYRTIRTVATTPTNFRMISTTTLVGHAQEVEPRWFFANNHHITHSQVFDDSKVNYGEAPF